MRKFIVKTVIFFVVFGLLFFVGIMLPATPASKNNMIAYKTEKDSLLMHVATPRIVFVGGSNLVFGLDSEKVKSELGLNPINAALAINFGLVYMMDDVIPRLKEGDIVVLAPEYQHYFGKQAYGGNDLLRLLMDVQPSGFSVLRKEHIPNLIKGIPIYFQSKFIYSQYFYEKEKDVYGRHIFNEYGDSNFHWNLETRGFPEVHPIRGQFNYELINEIKAFDKVIEALGGSLFVTYPGCDMHSLETIKAQVGQVKKELEASGLQILGDPDRYAMESDMMFDQIYHLSKKGVDRRTNLLIEDLNQNKIFSQ
ncbi:hypothetical protein [Lutimonas vermicola]|uniref:Uncharacterized protein n=1 Tax=Lutimonas vermicola TaxID=414288 RepID=A0ABU9KZ59_9FLAO